VATESLQCRLTLSLLGGEYVICRFAADVPMPAGVMAGPFVSITRTRDELSIVCLHDLAPPDTKVEPGWRCMRVEGPFELATAVGVLAALAVPLARAGVSIFAVSTYDTDYLLIQQAQIAQATVVLEEHGHVVRTDPLDEGVP
jgi:uncharacterized protein